MSAGKLSSEMVFGLKSVIFPIACLSKTYSYFTIFDKNFNDFKSKEFIQNDLILGATNPLFTKDS